MWEKHIFFSEYPSREAWRRLGFLPNGYQESSPELSRLGRGDSHPFHLTPMCRMSTATPMLLIPTMSRYVTLRIIFSVSFYMALYSKIVEQIK